MPNTTNLRFQLRRERGGVNTGLGQLCCERDGRGHLKLFAPVLDNMAFQDLFKGAKVLCALSLNVGVPLGVDGADSPTDFELQAEERNVELPAGVVVRVRETRCVFVTVSGALFTIGCARVGRAAFTS